MARGSPHGQAAWRDIGHARCTAVISSWRMRVLPLVCNQRVQHLPREEHIGGMLLRLARSMRIRVGRLVALAYLFCVLAPAASLAWGSGPAPCLDEAGLADLVPAHHQMPTSHLHGDASHDHAGTHAHHQAAAQDTPAPHHHGGKGTVGSCCAVMCISALPADLPTVATPVQPISDCAPEIVVSLRSAPPPQHYRPPIA